MNIFFFFLFREIKWSKHHDINAMQIAHEENKMIHLQWNSVISLFRFVQSMAAKLLWLHRNVHLIQCVLLLKSKRKRIHSWGNASRTWWKCSVSIAWWTQFSDKRMVSLRFGQSFALFFILLNSIDFLNWLSYFDFQ